MVSIVTMTVIAIVQYRLEQHIRISTTMVVLDMKTATVATTFANTSENSQESSKHVMACDLHSDNTNNE